jgi:hypothetical protein
MTTPIVHEVMVDWDATDWGADPTFAGDDDISDDVFDMRILRGKESEEGNAPAATLELRIKADLVSKYSPVNAASPLHDRIRPWLPIRVQTTHDGTTYPVYFGFISSIRIDPNGDNPSISLYCTDGTDLLARQMITQDWDNRTPMSDGAAIGLIADAAGWSITRRAIDTDGGSNLLNYPSVYVY